MAIEDIMVMVLIYNENLLPGEPEMTFEEMAGILGYERIIE